MLAVVEGAFMLTRLRRTADGQCVMPLITGDANPTPEDVATVGVARWVIHRVWPGRLGTA